MINSMNISWSLWVIIGGVTNNSAQNVVKNKTYDDDHWSEVTDLPSMTRAGINSEFLILRANSLKSGTSYAARVKGQFKRGDFGSKTACAKLENGWEAK